MAKVIDGKAVAQAVKDRIKTEVADYLQANSHIKRKPGLAVVLVGEDPVEKMRQLLKDREAYYLQADCEIKADVKSPAALADEVALIARERAGWNL